MATPSQIARSVRTILGDYNYWPTSESDSPLAVKTQKGQLTNESVLKLDASMRRKERVDDTPDYKVPTNRTVMTKTLGEIFMPLVNNTVDEISKVERSEAIAQLEMSAEKLEYLVQLYGAFSTMQNPRVIMVNTPSEPLVGMLICGETPIEGAVAPAPSVATIVAQTLLVQT